MKFARIYKTFKSLCGNTLFLVAAVVFVFCLFIASSYFAYKFSRRGTEQSLKSDIQYQTKIIANSIDTYIQGRKASVQQMANFRLVKEFLDNTRQETLEADPSFQNICSMLFVISGENKNIAIAWLASLKDDFSLSYNDISWEKNGWITRKRPWYSQTMESNDIYFSNPYWDFETGDVCVSLVKKVFAPNKGGETQDDIVGFAGLDLFFPPVRKTMESFVIKNEFYPILISHDGSILYHPDREYVFKAQLGDIDPALGLFTEKMIKAETDVRLIALNGGKDPVYFGYTPVPGTNWSVAVICDKDATEKSLIVFATTLGQYLLWNVFLFVFPLILMIFVVVYRKRRYQGIKRLYDTVVNQMQTGVAVINPTTDEVLLSNPAYQRYLGISSKQSGFFAAYRSLLGITGTIDQITTQEDAIKDIVLNVNDTENYFSHYFAAFESFDNQKLFLSVLTNVTELTRTQQSLREALDAAEVASRAKSSFLANVSHEIRTPMNGIIGLADLLAASNLDAHQSQHLGLIRSSAEALLTVINDILDHSKIDAGKMLIETYDFDLRRLIQELTYSFSHAAQQKSVVFYTTVAPDVPQHVQGDAHRLRQVLSNFLSNAVKFTSPSGHVEFRVVRLDELDKPDGISFAISDTGIGFTDEQKYRLFTPFEQGDNSTSRKFGGTGLGLTIAKQLIELMGGKVDCQSQPGVGSTFWCNIPLPPSSDAAPGEGSSTKLLMKSLHILLVDDVKLNLIVLSSMLQQWGHTIETAKNGVQAIERLKESRYDLVFMDCQMPEMDGYECTQKIRQPETAVLDPTVPIIAVTAHAMSGDRERCLESGMDDYIAKPINHRELKSLLSRWGTKVET